jgi:hypothetical protein
MYLEESLAKCQITVILKYPEHPYPHHTNLHIVTLSHRHTNHKQTNTDTNLSCVATDTDTQITKNTIRHKLKLRCNTCYFGLNQPTKLL